MSKSPASPQVQSIRIKLSNLAKKEGVGFQQVLTMFLLERAAARLLHTETLAKHLVFKGGFVSVRVYNSPRYTTDLDALVQGIAAAEAIEQIKAAMEVPLHDSCWFTFDGNLDLKTQGEYGGHRLIYRGGLGEPPPLIKTAQLVNIDLGIGDPVTPSPLEQKTRFTVGDGHLSWLVYPAETIVAEKLHALVTIGSRNSRAKDVYDVGLLLPKVSKETLERALKATFEFRGDKLPASFAATLEQLDKTSLRRSWPSAMTAVARTVDFDTIIQEVIRHLLDWTI